MKAQVIVIELVAVLTLLFVAVGTLLPILTYENKWSEAVLFLKARDLILTADRIGILHTIAFDQPAFQSFTTNAVTDRSAIFAPTTQGTFKSKIVIACNCTGEQIGNLSFWVGTLLVNQRLVSLDFVPSNLDRIPESDLLFIFGQRNLEPFKTNLKNYIGGASGIVLMADITQSQITSAHREIFGVTDCSAVSANCVFDSSTEDIINTANKVSDPFYTQYKMIYHLPLPVRAPDSVSSVPIEGGISPCTATTIRHGQFTFRQTINDFWICSTSVYFDTNGNGNADTIILERQNFAIGGFNFFMNYVKSEFIYISLRADYRFVDFLKNVADAKLAPVNLETNRVFMQVGQYEAGKPIPVVIVNGTLARTAWLADFTEQGVDDDEKLLLASLLVASANTQRIELPFGALQTGVLTSYINSANFDVFEIYRFNLGVGFPF